MPERIQLSRKRGWRKPEGVVNVARPTKWGNPWRVVEAPPNWQYKPGEWCVEDSGGALFGGFASKREAAAFAVERYRQAIEDDRQYGRNMLGFHYAELDELRGKDLACWCGPDDPCHGDPLLSAANEPHT